MFLLEITQIESPNLVNYAEDSAKANNETKKMLIKRQAWQPFTVRSLPWGSLTGPHIEHGSIILSYYERQSYPEQLKNAVDFNKQTSQKMILL